MGVVYKAHDTKLDRDVALKFLPHYLTSDAAEKERFYHEGKAAAALTHANIAVVYEIGEHDGPATAGKQVFIVMECVEGKTLRQIISGSTMSIKQVLDIAIQIAEGLNAAHKKGIVHRDVKPENIMLADDGGTVKIMDFGLAKLKGATRLTKPGSTLGTAAYMSPEQGRGEDVDQRTDIFSLGVVLYEMFAGKPPFRGEHMAALMYSIANEEPAPLARFNEQVTDELQHIVSKALEKDRDDRYQHVDDMLADLRRERKKLEYAKSGYVKVGQTVQAGRSAIAPIPRRRWKSLAIGSAAIVVLVVLVIIFNPFKQSTNQPVSNVGKSIAVLPFVDMSPQKDQEYFCDGMTEDLITRLGNLNNLHVPAGTSMFLLKGKDISEVGSKLHVGAVLEGSVQKSGDRLRITAKLISVADGYQLWSQSYNRELKDVFAIQDEISSAIVQALRLKLTNQEQQKLTEHPIKNIDAYEYYLKAWNRIVRFDEKSLDSAITYLQSAIDIVGDNADLYSGLSFAYFQYVNIGLGQEEYLRQSADYAKKALTLNPEHPAALVQLGILSIFGEYPKNWENNFTYLRKALSANPSSTDALYWTAAGLAQIGKSQEALAYAVMFERHDPLNPIAFYLKGYSHKWGCQFPEALAQFQKFYEADSLSQIAQSNYVELLAYSGERDRALAVIRQMKSEPRENAVAKFSLLLRCALLNDKQGALQLITPRFQKTCRRDFEWSYYVGSRLALANARNEALDWLENAVRRGFINYPFMQCDPLLNNIRGEERFKKLMEKAKYEWEHFEVPE